ncbi:unnamed protein product, partial [Allacma fusca]
SKVLTTFITDYGRFCFKRLPFGISSAPEHYQKRVNQALEGLSGVINHTDDILVWGSTIEEHDERFRAVLRRLAEKGFTLNRDKCAFGVKEVEFLGHRITSEGVFPDLKKIKAIVSMPPPSDVSRVRSFVDMVIYLGRFIPGLATELKPLFDLLKTESEFQWGDEQERAFCRVKEILTTAPMLAHFDKSRATVVSADSSSYGLGAVLRQVGDDGNLHPIAYASRTLSKSEKGYAQIEKEALAMVWACERFEYFILGLPIKVETDHKPLLSIMKSKNVDELSPRLQRIRMRMMRYTYEIFHTPGKELIAADTLSRNPLPETGTGEFDVEVDAQVSLIVQNIPVSDFKLNEIFEAQMSDHICSEVRKYCSTGCPSKEKLEGALKPYHQYRDEIAVADGLVMKGIQLIIPQCMQIEILQKIHTGHLGITKCRSRAKESVSWPGISTQIQQLVDKFPEIARLECQTASCVINYCKSIFARHGIPKEVRSDNGPQFEPLKTIAFQDFARDYGFRHITSSPIYPQSNGFIEAMVKVVKSGMKKNADTAKLLLEYRATPLANGYSPAELLMSRKLRTTLPTAHSNLQPKVVSKEGLNSTEEIRRDNQKRNYDRHHGARKQEELQPGEVVWITDKRTWGPFVQSSSPGFTRR